MRRELLGAALLGEDGGRGGLLVLRAGRRGGGDLIPLVWNRLMEAVELRKNQLAVLLVLGSCRLRWLPGVLLRRRLRRGLEAARAVLRRAGREDKGCDPRSCPPRRRKARRAGERPRRPRGGAALGGDKGCDKADTNSGTTASWRG